MQRPRDLVPSPAPPWYPKTKSNSQLPGSSHDCLRVVLIQWSSAGTSAGAVVPSNWSTALRADWKSMAKCADKPRAGSHWARAARHARCDPALLRSSNPESRNAKPRPSGNPASRGFRSPRPRSLPEFCTLSRSRFPLSPDFSSRSHPRRSCLAASLPRQWRTGRTLRSKVSSSKETPLLSFRGSRRRGALCPGSGSVFSRRAELRRVMTSPHWAEGSVAVVGVPAGGSWLHCVGRWAPSFWSWEVGRRAPSLSFSFQRSWVSFGGVGPRQGLAGPVGPRL